MSYKISLKTPSQLKCVCGLAIPNGYFHVMDMTFDNEQQFKNLKDAKGYAEVVIEKTNLAPGAYTSDGQAVDYRELHDWCFGFRDSKPVPISVTKVKESQESPDSSVDALDELRAELDAKGIKYRKNASEQALRGLLGEVA